MVKVKDLLIEALTFLDPKALSSALDRLQKDTRVHFVVKLEDSKHQPLAFRQYLTRIIVITRAKRSARCSVTRAILSYVVSENSLM